MYSHAVLLTGEQTIPARLSLFDFQPTPAVLVVIPRTRAQRVTRAVVSIVGAIAAAPLVFMIPPHIEWVIGVVVTGIYWARRNWIAEYVVASCAGVCPRCHKAVVVKPKTTLRLPHSVVCYACHEHPALEAGSAPPIDPARLEQVDAPVRPDNDHRPLRIWSPAGSDW